jgi:predicted DNA binding CopG/RHH family protein
MPKSTQKRTIRLEVSESLFAALERDAERKGLKLTPYVRMVLTESTRRHERDKT